MPLIFTKWIIKLCRQIFWQKFMMNLKMNNLVCFTIREISRHFFHLFSSNFPFPYLLSFVSFLYLTSPPEKFALHWMWSLIELIAERTRQQIILVFMKLIQILLSNQPNTYVRRSGEDECTVWRIYANTKRLKETKA